MVGYRIAPWLWNNGICTEAMRRVVEFIFSETSMDRLQGNAEVRNISSNKELQKSGYQYLRQMEYGTYMKKIIGRDKYVTHY
ncbi:MAG: GNAT family N-acetyltransferase [Lachnospiraceae bacterium]|nr:GNAT family N-acetyltransferase [Lachnospiraceae bacterium]